MKIELSRDEIFTIGLALRQQIEHYERLNEPCLKDDINDTKRIVNKIYRSLPDRGSIPAYKINQEG